MSDVALGLVLGLYVSIGAAGLALAVSVALVNADLRALLRRERDHIERIAAERDGLMADLSRANDIRTRLAAEVTSLKAAVQGARAGTERLVAANRELARRLRARRSRTKTATPTPARRSPR